MKTSEILTYKRVGTEEKAVNTKVTEILFVFLGLLAGRVELWGMIMPTGVGWGIACSMYEKKEKRIVWGILCSIAGMFMSGIDIFKLRGVVTLILFYSLYKAKNRIFKENIMFCASVGSVVNFISGAIIFAVNRQSVSDYILLSIESLLIAGATLSFYNVLAILNRGGTLLGDDEVISAFVVAACIAAGLKGISIVGVKPSSLFSMYMIILFSKKSGISVSVTLAVVLGIASGGEDIVSLMGLFLFMAIGCSLLASVGKWGSIIGAAAANALYVACQFGGDSSFARVFEITISLIAFYLTPAEIIDSIVKYTSKKITSFSGEGRYVKYKQETDEAIKEIEQAVSCVADVVKQMNEGEKEKSPEEFFDNISRTVCSSCALDNYCRDKNRIKTEQAIEYILKVIKDTGNYNVGEIEKALGWKCIHLNQVVTKVKDTYGFYKEKESLEQKIKENKEYVLQGLEDMAEIVRRQRKRMFEDYNIYQSLSEEISDALVRNGVSVRGVLVIKNRSGLFEVMAEIEAGGLGFAEEIIKDIMKIKMKTISEEKTRGATVLTLREKEHFKYDVAVLSMDNKDRRTGDCATWFEDGRGNLNILIGDGMGSGVLAAKESGWTCNLYEKLSRAGFEQEETFRMINNVMIAGKPTESCISADAVKINLCSGMAEFIKAGAASSYIKTKKGAEKIGWSSIPLGILEINETESKFVDVSEGGYIVIMSDGVPDTSGDRMEGEHNIRKALEQCDETGPREIAEHLMFASLAMGAPKDDMTIVVAKIFKE